MQIAFLPDAFVSRLFGPSPAAARPRVTRWFAAHVRHGATRELTPPPGRLTLHCRDGQAWITQDGVPKDVVLDASESYTADSGSRMTVHALKGDCVFEIQVDD